MATVDLFHYTDKKGYEGIINAGYILASSGRGPCVGMTGVYLTTLDPSEDRKGVADTIFRGGGTANYSKGKLDHYIRVAIPKSDRRLQEVRKDVWCFEDDLLMLKSFKHDGGDKSTWSAFGKGALLAMAVGGLAALALSWGSTAVEEEKEKGTDDKRKKSASGK